jgi:NADH-quinone oxidoreductase subunit C
MTGAELLSSLQRMFGARILAKTEFRGETTFLIARENLHEVAQFCRDELCFDYLLDVSSVDNFGHEPRFEVVYLLYSLAMGIHLRLRVTASEDDPTVDTVSDIWVAADWHEREVYDMMGIRFNNHPDLRRILMWEGYPYFPLRKEFPVEGLPSNMPDVAFTAAAPLEGGPFVTVPSTATTKDREPRARRPADSD